MDESSFLKSHNNGLGKLLQIRFLSAGKDRVVAEMSIGAEHFTRPDVVHGGILMALADCTSAYGAVLNLPPDTLTATIESKTNFLRKGAGDRLRAESVPLHVGATTSVWRATLYRDGKAPIAEVTQTQIVLPEREVAETATDGDGPAETSSVVELPRRADRTELSKSFSQSIVDERRKRIFEGACRVISEKGFANATIREIAAAADMPVPTMYQYVKGKGELLYGIYEYFMGDIVEALHACQASEAPPQEKVERAIRAMIDQFDKNHKYIKILFQETQSLTPEARQHVYRLDGQYIGVLKELLDGAVASRAFEPADTELAANLIYFLCVVWPLRHWALGKFGQQVVADAIVKLVLEGMSTQRKVSPKTGKMGRAS